ncbi:hypothetical protein [Paracoccus laeviglucosivorans]|uniref:hypothetical protein n=1 Tax=Paracoccus laeviglucosivorans TaxID=1197861 RepID=UPI0011581001|nr:hypothetical protein [Paracoccus laeviglucosivorans]
MARIGPPPETHYDLPTDFAAMLGQCVASFGWLEEILKRAIFALDRARLADDLTPQELQVWLLRMGTIADDSMGTLIERLDSSIRRHPGLGDRDAITDQLHMVKRHRNHLCHASWRPTADKELWHPAFVNTRGEPFDHALSIGDLQAILRETVEIGQRVIGVMRATGIQGYWAGDDQA